MRDNWCIGYTSDYTVGVWVGNFNGQPMWNVSGMTGAAPIWRQLMMGLHRGPSRDELAHYEAPEAPLLTKTISRIRYPQANMLIGLDPDIPRARQRVSIQIVSPQTDHVVFVDGRRLAQADATVFWEPRKGRHQVELRTRQGAKVDDVSFVVR